MPIDYKKYTKDWKEIRERILKRAKNKCECCGLENHIVVSSYKKEGKTVWFEQDLTQWMRSNCFSPTIN